MSNGFIWGEATWGGRSGGLWSSDTERLDIEWRIGEIVADSLVSEQPPPLLGQEVSMSFRFDRGSPHGDHIERYLEIRDKAKWSHAVVTKTLLDGTPKYKEQHTQDYTLALPVEPGQGTVATQGYWAVITGFEEQSTVPQMGQTITLDLFLLEELETYNSIEEMEEVHRI